MSDTFPRPTSSAGLEAVQAALWRPDCPLVPLMGDTYATYDDIAEAYANSPAGKHQATQPPRFFAGFGCEDITAELLLELHPDTHPVGHMEQTHDTFQQVAAADPQHFTPTLAALGRLSALLHDTGETTHPETAAFAGVNNPPGDIAYGSKQSFHRIDEEKIRRTVYRTVLPELPDNVINDMEDINSHRAKPGEQRSETHDHPLAVIFESLQVAHNIGALGVSAAAVTRAMQARKFGGRINKPLLTLGMDIGPETIENLKRQAPAWRMAGIAAARYGWMIDMRDALNRHTFITT